MKATRAVPVAGFSLVALLLTACDDREPHPYPAEVEASFMQACDGNSDENTRACRCILKAIQREYTFEEFTEIDEGFRSGDTDDAFQDYVDRAAIPCYVVNLI